MIKTKYKAAGYDMPKIIFWNLAGRTDNVSVKFDKEDTAVVSGFSPAILKSILADDLAEFTPANVMMKTIMSDRYSV